MKLRRIGIDTRRESIAFLDADDLLDRALGLHPLDRVEVSSNSRTILAVLYTVEGSILEKGTIGLSDMAFEKLGVSEDTIVDVRPADVPSSADLLRAKMSGRELSSSDFAAVINDAVPSYL